MGKDLEDWDVIALSGLRASGSHGVYDFERAGSQDFVADVTLYVDATRASVTDDVSDTVDYSKVAEDAVRVLTGPSVYLIETLASRLAELALSYPGVHRVQVTVHKPMAPLEQNFTDVSVTVVRERRGVTVAPPRGRVGRHTRPAGDSVPPQLPQTTRSPDHTNTELKAAKQAPQAPEGEVRTAVRRPHRPTSPSPSGKHGSRSVRPQFSKGSPRRASVVYDVVLALGGNRGDVVANLRGAVEALACLDGFEVLAVSPLVETEPVLEPGALPQDNYLNAVVLGRTVLAPPALLAELQAIEARFGRERRTRWGARTLDIDIIDLDGMRLNTRSLTLPHPRAAERAFVLYPWSLVDSEACVPGCGAVGELLGAAQDLPGVLAEYPNWLEGDANGGPGERSDLQLAPRPARQQAPTGPVRKVVLRGEEVTLTPVDRDPIFEALLSEEERRAGKVPLNHARSGPRPVVAPPAPPTPGKSVPRSSEEVSPARVSPVHSARVAAAARPESVEERPAAVPQPPAPHSARKQTSIPRSHPRHEGDSHKAAVQTSSSRSSRLEQPLPEWDFGAETTPVRVVDSLEATDQAESSASPRTSQIPRVVRGVTVRPTKTGSVPLTRPRQSAR